MLHSIIIPLYNSSHIATQLLSFEQIRFTELKAEFIFVDDGSDPGHLLVYESTFAEHAKNLNIRFFSLGEKHGCNRVCLARNTGARESIGNRLVFIDQDTLLNRDFFSALWEVAVGTQVVVGPYLGYNDLPKSIRPELVRRFLDSETINEGVLQDFRIPGFHDASERGRSWELVCWSNICIWKDIFSEVGWFDESIITWGDEDVEFWYRLHRAGYEILFDESITVLNVSEKLYRPPFRRLENNKVSMLSDNWVKNYEKHKALEYKCYVYDRYDHLPEEQKSLVSKKFRDMFLNRKHVLVHAINGIGLGHIRRTLAIAEQLSRDPSIGRIIFLTNSQHTEFIEQKWFAVERIDIGIEDTLCGMKFSDYESGTHARLDAIVRLHDISVVIHDTFFIRPFVCEHRDLMHFLVLRDSDLEYMQSISNSFWYFRAIFLPHLEHEFSDKKRQFVGQFPNIYFSWYVLGGDIPFPDESIGPDSILVSPGLGGDLDQTVDFFSHVLEVWKKLHEISSERWIFVLGKHARELRNRLDFPSRSHVVNISADMWALLSRSEVLVGRGGYNTLNEVCYAQKKSLLLPASRVAEDQSRRIRYFEGCTNFIRAGVWDAEEDVRTIRSLRSLRSCSSRFKEQDFWWAGYIVHSIIREIRKKRVLVYKHIFLPRSEQFLRAEFELFQKISPRFLSLAPGEMPDVSRGLYDRLHIAPTFWGLLHPEYPFVRDRVLYKRFLGFIRAYLDREWIDTIYTPFLSDAFFLWPLKRVVPGLRIYSAARWYDAYVFLQKLGPMSRKFLVDLQGIFSRDLRMQDHLCRIGDIDRTRVPVVRSAIRLESYYFRTPSLFPLRILIGGRFVEKKWLLSLLDLLARMRTMGCQIERVTLVGDGDLRSAILDRIIDLWLSDAVLYVGMVDHAKLLDLLGTHSCYIAYSRPAADGDDEGISNLLVENMLVGNLVFSTISGGNSEVLRERETGFVLSWDPQLDAERVLAVLRILKSSPFEYTSILENGRDLARSVFNPAHSIQLLESILAHE